MKKKFQFWVWGSHGGVTSGGVFGLLYPALDANPMGQYFSSSFLVETRLSSESLELLIGFLANLNANLCHKNQKVVKLTIPTKETWVE